MYEKLFHNMEINDIVKSLKRKNEHRLSMEYFFKR